MDNTSRAQYDTFVEGVTSENGGEVGQREWEEIYPLSTRPEEDPRWLSEFCESMGV